MNCKCIVVKLSSPILIWMRARQDRQWRALHNRAHMVTKKVYDGTSWRWTMILLGCFCILLALVCLHTASKIKQELSSYGSGIRTVLEPQESCISLFQLIDHPCLCNLYSALTGWHAREEGANLILPFPSSNSTTPAPSSSDRRVLFTAWRRRLSQ